MELQHCDFVGEVSMLYIYSTFTAQPLRSSLNRVLNKFTDVSLSFQYGNLFPVLLNPQSDLYQQSNAMNVVLIRMSDIVQYMNGSANNDKPFDALLLENSKLLAHLLTKAFINANKQNLVIVCPNYLQNDSARHALYQEAEALFMSRLRECRSLTVRAYDDIEAQYPCEEKFNPLGDLQGHVPYTPRYFSALGLTIARHYHQQLMKPFKVIVVDCDGTLWDGIVDEVGIRGIVIDEHRKALQQFLIKQQQSGMLLCVCSKNREEIVLQAFREHSDMQLSFETHIVAHRVNWQTKSSNIKGIAQQLNLGLDSFIFIDDQALECAEVRTACPEVLTLHLPERNAELMPFLQNVWAFDHVTQTEVGATRTLLYKQEAQRKQMQQQAADPILFIQELQLQVNVDCLQREDIPRVAELTVRTNQFNLNPCAKTEMELSNAEDNQMDCLAVHVVDRFGSYGLSGVLFYHKMNDTLYVDNFLLSCRVLSRGVEFQVVKKLRQKMLDMGCNELVFLYRHTEKNEPAKIFLQTLLKTRNLSDCAKEVGFKESDLVDIQFMPSEQRTQGVSTNTTHPYQSLDYLLDIATHCQSVDQMCASAQKSGGMIEKIGENDGFFLLNHLEELINSIVKNPLASTSDSLISQGIDSVEAVQLVGAIDQQFSVQLNYCDLLSENYSLKTILKEIKKRQSEQEHNVLLTGSTEDQNIPQSYVEDKFPLSQPQLRLWLDDTLEKSTKNNMLVAFRLQGQLNIPTLQEAMCVLVDRHESLRTTFHSGDDLPYQWVHEKGQSVTIHKEYLSNTTLTEKRVSQIAHTPFDLETYPLYRIHVIHTGKAGDTIFVLSMHHIISDGWSLNILLKELNILYNAFVRGVDNPLPPIRTHYRNYVYQQQKNCNFAADKAFWKTYLHELPVLDMPKDTLATAGLNNSQHVSFSISKAHTQALKAMAKAHNMTLYSIVFNAYAVLLMRYCGQSDFGIITASSGRQSQGIADVMGFFVNLMIARHGLDPSLSFAENMSRYAEQPLFTMMQHQMLPFNEVLNLLNIKRYQEHRNVLPAAFVFQNYTTHELHLDQLSAQRCFSDNHALLYDESDQCRFGYFACYMRENADELEGLFEYNVNVFYQKTIEELVECFTTVIEQIVAHSEQPIGKYALVNAERQVQLLSTWNPPFVEYDPHKLLAHYFAEQVQAHPDKIAITHGDERVTYRELNVRANRLAHCLVSKGLESGAFVAFCFDRGIAAVVSMLAICKIGAVYIPLDPATPLKRNQIILADASPQLVVTEKKYALAFSQCVESHRLLEYANLVTEEYSDEEVLYSGITQQPIYMMYTSGTTGKPKGIIIPQSGVIRLVIKPNYITISSEDVIAQASNIAFDAATFEIWGALLNGSRLVVIDNDAVIQAENLWSILQKENVTILWLTAQLFHLYAQDTPEIFSNLTYLLSGGDQISIDAVHNVLRSPKPPKYFLNGYGPTENTTFATVHKVSSHDNFRDLLPIGVPINNTHVYVLDDYFNLVPPGSMGRHYVSGDGLGTYFNLPLQNKKSFVPNPFVSEEDKALQRNLVLYDTGDLVRMDDEGRLYYLGRMDHQVKINGFRVELNEIAESICDCSDVKQAVVFLTENKEGNKILSAFVRMRTACELSPCNINNFLKEQLPTHMLPTVYYNVDTFPINANGKIDRERLLAMELKPGYVRDTTTIELPKTLLQTQLVKLYASAFSIPESHIGLHDDFFNLGGNSIALVKLTQDIKKQFSVHLPLSQLYQTITVATLSELIEEQQLALELKTRNSYLRDSLIEINKGKTDRPPLILIHPIGGTGFCYRDLYHALDEDQPCYIIQDPSVVAQKNLFGTIDEMAKQYLELLFARFGETHFILGGYSFGGMIALEMAHQMEQLGKSKQLHFIALFDTWVMSGVEQKSREILKRAMLKRYASVKEVLVKHEGLEEKMWLEINYHRLQNMGFVYNPSVIDASVILFKAMEQYKEFEQMQDRYNFLSAYTKKSIKVHQVVASHDTILEAEHGRVVAELLKHEIMRAQVHIHVLQSSSSQKAHVFSNERVDSMQPKEIVEIRPLPVDVEMF
jgi:amino acid adenylation domain-containing protein/FkbH-like protein